MFENDLTWTTALKSFCDFPKPGMNRQMKDPLNALCAKKNNCLFVIFHSDV